MTFGPELITVAICSIGEVGDSLDACLASLAAAGVTRPTVLRAEAGMAGLRNMALAECRTPVIAFVDDDVIVEPDWLDELARAWSSADPRVACIGGPITVGAHPASAGWMTDSLAGIVTANTPRVDDPSAFVATGSFCGGNVSFQADALRGVQGFWPARGAGRLRDWFSEEHHIQRELGRAGWASEMVDGLAVTRLVDSRDGVRALASAQAVAGARRRMLGADVKSEWKSAVKSSAGALAAAAGRNRDLAAERLVRAAGHAGTAVPGIAAGTVQASSSSTPFRHSVPNGSSRRARGSVATYCYHRVNDEEVPSGLAVSPAAFRSQLEELLERGRPSNALEISLGDAPSGSFAITFDDGYADNLHVALPILEELEVPATFFVTTGHVMEDRRFWWDTACRLLQGAAEGASDHGVLQLTCEGETRSWAPASEEQLRETCHHLTAWLQSRDPEAISQALDELEQWAGFTPDPGLDRPLTPEELLELSRHPLVTVGAHTRTHPNLRFCTPERLAYELAGARTDLAELVDQEVEILAYPFGVWGADVNREVADAAHRAGYRAGFLNGGEPSRPTRLGTPRLPVIS